MKLRPIGFLVVFLALAILILIYRGVYITRPGPGGSVYVVNRFTGEMKLAHLSKWTPVKRLSDSNTEKEYNGLLDSGYSRSEAAEMTKDIFGRPIQRWMAIGICVVLGLCILLSEETKWTEGEEFNGIGRVAYSFLVILFFASITFLAYWSFFYGSRYLSGYINPGGSSLISGFLAFAVLFLFYKIGKRYGYRENKSKKSHLTN